MCISPGTVVASYFAANTVSSLPASWTLPPPHILASWWGFKQYLTWRYDKANTQAIKGMFYNHGLTRFFSLAFDRKKKREKKELKKPYDFKHAECPSFLSLWICFPMSKGESLLGSNKQVPWDCSVLLQSCTKPVDQERDVGQKPGVPPFKGHLMGNGFIFFLRKWSDEQFAALLVVLLRDTVLCTWSSKGMTLIFFTRAVVSQKWGHHVTNFKWPYAQPHYQA